MDGASGLSLQEVARLIDGRVVGDGSRIVSSIAPLDEAGPEDISLLAMPRYRALAESSTAGALLVKEGLDLPGRDQVVVQDPYYALTVLVPRLHPEPAPRSGISEDARVARDARIGEGAWIGPFAVVDGGARIGARARIGAGVYVGEESEVGDESVLHPNVTIYHRCSLGRRVIVHAGAVVGSDGFGFASRAGVHHKIPQVGGVVVEDDVEIGAGVTIDRGSIGPTIVGRGTKIDNLVQIAHNVRIGPGCLIVAQSGISGSTRIGAGAILAGQAGAAGHLTIGAGAIVASKSAVYDDVAAGARVAGIPAIDMPAWRRAQAVFKRLPELMSRVRALELRPGGGDGERPRAGRKPAGSRATKPAMAAGARRSIDRSSSRASADSGSKGDRPRRQRAKRGGKR